MVRRHPYIRSGFTIIELMIVVIIIGVLAMIAIPNLIAMENRNKEGRTKANMHTVQLVAEECGVESDGVYPTSLTQLTNRLPATFKNPFTGEAKDVVLQLVGSDQVKDHAFAEIPKGRVVVLVDSAATEYAIYGGDFHNRSFSLVLTSGQ